MTLRPTPPALAQQLLQAVLPPALADSFLGDLEEQFKQLVAGQGAYRARLWHWQETLLALPQLTLCSFELGELRRLSVNGPTSTRQPIWGTALSLLLLFPALILVIPGLLFNFTGVDLPTQLANLLGPLLRSWVESPWIILGGLALALAINTIAVANVNFEDVGEAVSFTFEFRKRTANLLLLGLVIFLGLSIFGYLIAENLLPPL